MASAHEVDHAFDVGQRVEARQQFGTWLEAIIVRLEPYRGRPGYYVSYPSATEQWHCWGGWVQESCIRLLDAKEARP